MHATLLEEMLSRRTAAGLLSEDIDPSPASSGATIPQTYSLVGLINCAMLLSKTLEHRAMSRLIVISNRVQAPRAMKAGRRAGLPWRFPLPCANRTASGSAGRARSAIPSELRFETYGGRHHRDD